MLKTIKIKGRILKKRRGKKRKEKEVKIKIIKSTKIFLSFFKYLWFLHEAFCLLHNWRNLITVHHAVRATMHQQFFIYLWRWKNSLGSFFFLFSWHKNFHYTFCRSQIFRLRIRYEIIPIQLNIYRHFNMLSLNMSKKSV